MIQPLNGTKTHPLSEHALGVLMLIKDAPRPSSEFNPGVVNRLMREDLARERELPSPYRNGPRKRPHLYITPHGERALAPKE